VNLSTGTITYLVGDLLGSVRGTVSSAGALTATTAYDAWGNPETTGGLTAATPFGYAGGYTDATGLIYLQQRYYDPQTGQFISVDPAFERTLQAYIYADDNPVENVDPTGKYLFGVYLPTECAKDGSCFHGQMYCDSAKETCSVQWSFLFASYMWDRLIILNFDLFADGNWVNGGYYGHNEYGWYTFHSSAGVPTRYKSRGRYTCGHDHSCWIRTWSTIDVQTYGLWTSGNQTGDFSAGVHWEDGCRVSSVCTG
jgi:RHS repeat-associated protein